MAGKFFISEPGKGIIIGSGQPGAVSGFGNCIIVNMGFSHETNTQFMPTLGGRIYANAFGDKVGIYEVSGVTTNNLCQESGDDIATIFSKYQRERYRGGVLSVTVASGGFRPTGQFFLTGFNASVVNQEARLFGFTLRYSVII